MVGCGHPRYLPTGHQVWWWLRYRVCWTAARGKRGDPGSREGMEVNSGTREGELATAGASTSGAIDYPRRRTVFRTYHGTDTTTILWDPGPGCSLLHGTVDTVVSNIVMLASTVQCRRPYHVGTRPSYQVGTPGTSSPLWSSSALWKRHQGISLLDRHCDGT